MHWASLHELHCIQSGTIAPKCMEYSHSTTLHGIHCIKSCCIKSTAFNRVPFLHAAWNPLHSITLHGIHCIQSGSIGPHCMESTAFTRDPFHNAAWNPVHSIIPHVIQCINQDQLGHAAWNPLHSIWIHWAMLHGSNCIQSGYIALRCMESTAFNRDALGHAA